MMIKTLLITNQIAPYRIPVYNIVNSTDDIDFTVWFLEEKEANRQWDIEYSEMRFNYRCLKGFHIFVQSMDFGFHFNPGLFFKLIKENPDVIMTTSYDAIGYWVSLFYAKMFGKKFVVWWGSTLESSRVKNKVMKSIRKFYFKCANSFITYGTQSADCLNYYGIPDNRIAVGYNTVDIKYYYQRGKYLSTKLNLENKQLNFLFIGQLIKRKGLEQAITALAKTNKKNWKLTVVGAGPEKDNLKKFVHELNLQKNVTFEGYKQKEELINYLVEADCLLFPSLIEVWGLVVNEALVTNTFVVSSKYAGVTKDLITHQENGIIVDPLDELNMIHAVNWLFDHLEYVKREKKFSLSLWKKLHPRTYARSVMRAIKIAVNNEKKEVDRYASEVSV